MIATKAGHCYQLEASIRFNCAGSKQLGNRSIDDIVALRLLGMHMNTCGSRREPPDIDGEDALHGTRPTLTCRGFLA